MSASLCNNGKLNCLRIGGFQGDYRIVTWTPALRKSAILVIGTK
jgi:hypothetical protein